MAQRSLLCIEPDAATVGEIRRVFGAYGFRVESIPNGEQAVEWARTNNPALIILSVEPRKVGYAICNKLKRSPSLREIPLILISAEETMATFEQHKKLKSRAEEYMLKPLDMHALLAKSDRLIALGDAHTQAVSIEDDDSAEIEIADDEIAEVSSLDEDDGLVEEEVFSNAEPTHSSARAPEEPTGRGRPASPDTGRPDDPSVGQFGLLGEDTAKPITSADPSGSSPFNDAASRTNPGAETPFDPEHFDPETQAAFAALEAGASEGGELTAGTSGGYSAVELVQAKPVVSTGMNGSADVVDLQSLWTEGELPGKLPWEEESRPESGRSSLGTGGGQSSSLGPAAISEERGGNRGGIFDPYAGQLTPPFRTPDPSPASEDVLLAGLGTEVPPLPEEVLYAEHSAADAAAKDQLIAELQARSEDERRLSEGRVAELQMRIASLEAERLAVRKEQEEQRERMSHAASQGAFSKERDLLGLREIINRKEKDILDLRDAMDAKERLILDHKDKIREHERARRDLEERTLGFEKSLVAANEKVAELLQDKEKSVEREKGLKARLDDAHEELRKGQDEAESLRKRVAQEIERGRIEVEKTRIELEARLAEAEESHRNSLSKTTDEWAFAAAADKAGHQAELSRVDAAHRAEVEALQRRLAEEVGSAAERLQTELLKLRRDQEKAIASLKEEQALQLASERDAYERQTDAKHRAYREEVMGLRRRHEEELAAAEDRRQRDILEQEQRRISELEQAETRRRVELQARDEEHHIRVTDLERRHLIEKTEVGERHRTEHDQAVGRAVRAEGELVARAQEIEQAYRRLAGFEADLDAARAELGDRDVKLSQLRDRVNELEGKAADYEDQIVRAYQRLRSDEKTTEKVRRALAVGLTLLDERSASATAQAPLKSPAGGEEAEKS